MMHHHERALRVTVACFATWLMVSGAATAQDQISVGYGAGSPGTSGVTVPVVARNELALHGYSLAVRFPLDVMEVREFGVDGTHVFALAPDFVAPRIDNELGIATLGVIMNFDESPEISAIAVSPDASADKVIGRLTVDVKPGAPGGLHPIRLVDGIGQPAISNRFTSGGINITPELADGSFFVEGGNALSLDRSIAIPGGSRNLPIFAYARHPEALAGFSIAVLYDGEGLQLNTVDTVATDLSALVPSIEFFQTDIDDTIDPVLRRSRTGVIFDYLPPFEGQELPPSTAGLRDQTILRYQFDVPVEARAEKEYQDLLLHNTDVAGSLNNLFFIGTNSYDPYLVHGRIYFSTGAARGRVIDQNSGSPLANARVRLEPDGPEVTTRFDGSFDVTGVIPGAYAVTVSRSGYYPSRIEGLHVAGGATTDDWGDMTLFEIGAQDGGGSAFLRGDANNDGRGDISDTVFLLNYLFKGDQGPACQQAGDSNDDNRIDISDAVSILNWLFQGGPQPAAPYPNCGTDPDGGDLTCEFSRACP